MGHRGRFLLYVQCIGFDGQREEYIATTFGEALM